MLVLEFFVNSDCGFELTATSNSTRANQLLRLSLWDLAKDCY